MRKHNNLIFQAHWVHHISTCLYNATNRKIGNTQNSTRLHSYATWTVSPRSYIRIQASINSCQTCPLLKILGVLSQNKRLGLEASVSQNVEYSNKGRIKESALSRKYPLKQNWHGTSSCNISIHGRRKKMQQRGSTYILWNKIYHIHSQLTFSREPMEDLCVCNLTLVVKEAVSIKPTLWHNFSQRK